MTPIITVPQPRITQAAVLYRGQVWTLPQPARHHIILQAIAMSYWDPDKQEPCQVRDEIQGFITNEGKFVTRTDAFKLALEAGQLKHINKDVLELKKHTAGMLFSEDLW
jgi:hypothetical protein